MDDLAGKTERFQEHRAHLRAVAYRMLGSLSEADDAVQEAWIRFDRTDTTDVENLRGWLTTVVSRVALNILRSRRTRREDPLQTHMPDVILDRPGGTDPEHEALLADSVGVALLVVLDTLSAAERLAFVLHDIFAVPFDEIAPIVERSPEATRQLASRARRRIQGEPTIPDVDVPRQREVVDAFLAAARDGDFDALLAVLDPDVVVRADQGAVPADAVVWAGRPPLRCVVRLRWPAGRWSSPSSACWRSRRSSTVSPGPSPPATGWRSRSAPSPCAAGRSSPSTSWPTPNACAHST